MFCAKLHLRQGKQEGQGRFRSLVPVDPIYMQPIAAAAGLGRVEFESEIVPADEPVKGALRLFIPPDVRCGAIGFQTGRDGCLRLNGLLVEIGARAAAAVEPITANRAESDPSRTSAIPSASAGPRGPAAAPLVVRLHVRSQSRRARASRCRTTVPLQTIASPDVRTRFKALHEPASQCLPGLVDQAVAAQPAQIFMDADQAERPSPRRSELCQRRQRQREELSRHHLEAPKGRTSHAYAQRPERPPLTVLRSLFVQPVPLKTQVVVEAFRFEIESVMEERRGWWWPVPARDSGSSPNSPSSTARTKARALSSVQ